MQKGGAGPVVGLRRASRAQVRDVVDGRGRLSACGGDAQAAITRLLAEQLSRHELEAGLAEMRRVTRGPVVLLVCDPAAMMDYWLADYIPEVREIEANRFPSMERIEAALVGTVVVEHVPVPLATYM